jgi:CrcB protein
MGGRTDLVIALMVALGAVVGAPTRYLADRAVQSRHTTRFPSGTFVVNVFASLVLGFVLAAPGLSDSIRALIGAGFCGSLSTFSTWSFETVRLVEQRATRIAVANVGLSLVVGVAAAFAGYGLGAALC